MKCSFLLTLTTAFLMSSNANAARSLILFGGGGDPKNSKTTIFDDTLKSLDSYLQNNSWTTQISFDGGHEKTDAYINDNFQGAQNKSGFTPNNFNAIIKYSEGQIKNGVMKSGDQLMIMIDSHGAVKVEGETTHQVAWDRSQDKTNFSTLEGMSTVSLDDLKGLTELAEQKGIKLAIVDFSGHSGNTLGLSNSKTCVISSAGANHFAYNSFSDSFIRNMKAGKNLENVFLDTRRASSDNSYPMISSPAGNAISTTVYPTLYPYLYSFESEPSVDKLKDYFMQTSTDAGRCAREDQFKTLQKRFESLAEVGAANLDKNMVELQNLKKLVNEYKLKQDKYITMLNSWGVPELSRVEQFQGVGRSGKKTERINRKYTWQEILDSDYDTILKNLNSAKNGAVDPSTIAMFDAAIDLHKAGQAKQREILSKYPQLKDYKEKFADQMEELKSTYQLTSDIGAEERKLFDKMYTYLSKEKTAAKNPCKDFVL